MKSQVRKLILLLILLMPVHVLAQDKAEQNSPASSKMKRKKAKMKWKEQRQIEREHKKAVKEHHKRIQTKQTRKMMKKERRKGEMARSGRREFFLIRWIKSF